jgi:hypothetical protein
MTDKTDGHYVNNQKFLEAMSEWKDQIKIAEDSGEGKPPISEYIGECFLLIAERLSMRANFINYPFREEMVGDAIENCLMYASNFDPEKSKNPFSYFTQIIYYAFLRRIQKEKKQNYIKYKIVETADHMGSIARFLDPDRIKGNPYAEFFKLTTKDIENFTPKRKKKKKAPTKKKKKKTDGDDKCDSLF